MSKLSKTDIEAEFSKISQTNKIIAQNLRDAKASGDDEKYQSLIVKLRTLEDRERFLHGQYTLLQEQEAKPELERISKLFEELRQPNVSPPPTGFSPYGLMPGIMPGAPFPEPVNYPTAEQDKQRKRDIVAQIYNLPKKGDEKIPTSLMAQIETLYDPRSKAQLLENTYGKGTVLAVDIAGDTEFFVKLPDGSVKTTLDKGVAALAGIAAETPVLAAEIGTFLGIGAATKSPILAVAGSSAAGAGVGAGIDEALRFSYGLESDFGNTLARRGAQAVIGAGIGGVTDVAIPIMRSARIPDPFENKFALELEEAAERLMTSERKLAAKEGRKAGQIQVPAGARLAGQEGIEMQSEFAGTYARSNITSAALTTQETLLRLANNIKGKIPATPNDFADIAARKEAQKNALFEDIASLTGRKKRIIDAALERQTKGQLSNTDNLGKILRDEIKSAEDQAIKDTTQQYDVLADVAERANFQISAKELLEKLPEIKARINPGGAFDEAAVSKVEQDLIRQRQAPVRIYDAGEELKSLRRSLATLTKERLSGKKISKSKLNEIKANELRYQGEIQNLTREIKELQGISGPLDFRAFDAYIRRFNDARPDNAVGGTTKDVFGVGISKELSEFRRNVYSQVDVTYPDGTVKNLGDEFQTATELVKERAAFEKNTLGGILKEAAGEQATTPRDIVGAVLKEPFTVNRVTQALRKLGESDPTKAGDADKVLRLLQLEYMNNIGIGRGGATNVKVDTGMLDSLFGKEAAAQKRSIEELNRNIGKIKGLDASNLSFDDIKRMGQSLSETERKSLAKTITKRLQAEKEEERLVNSSVFKLAHKRNFNNIDPDTLSKAILSSSSTTTDTIVAMRELSEMSLEARNLYKGDFMRALLDKFPGGTPTANAPFETLFDTKKFIAAYKSPNETGKTAFAKKLEVVLGQEQARELYDIARLYEANIVTNTSKAGFNPRFVATNRGVILGLPLGQLLLSTKNRIITGMLSSSSQRNALKRALSKTAMPGAVNDAYNKMAREMFLTRTGLTALAHQASNDPEFSAELTNMANEFQKKEGLDLGGKSSSNPTKQKTTLELPSEAPVVIPSSVPLDTSLFVDPNKEETIAIKKIDSSFDYSDDSALPKIELSSNSRLEELDPMTYFEFPVFAKNEFPKFRNVVEVAKKFNLVKTKIENDLKNFVKTNIRSALNAKVNNAIGDASVVAFPAETENKKAKTIEDLKPNEWSDQGKERYSLPFEMTDNGFGRFVALQKRNNGSPYAVLNKEKGVLSFFNANGELLRRTPALTGKTPGDIINKKDLETDFNKRFNLFSQNNTSSKFITPAGKFEVKTGASKDYGKSIKFKFGKTYDLAIHKVYMGRPVERREERLKGKVLGSRISMGCVNLLDEDAFFANKHFASGGTLFILPETEKGYATDESFSKYRDLSSGVKIQEAIDISSKQDE